MIAPKRELPASCRFVDHDSVMAALTPDQAMALRFVAGAHGLLDGSGATAALIPEGDHDLAHLLSGAMHACWVVEADCFDEFLNDPALHGYLQRGVPVVAVFGAYSDYERLRRLVPDLRLSDDDQALLDSADDARCDAAAEARLDADEHDEPTWDDGE